MIKSAKKIRLKTKLGQLIQSEPRGHSEILSPFFSEEGDPFDEIATELDLDSIHKEDVEATRKELLQGTQESLRQRGLPEVLTVYRYGNIRGGDVTSVTLDASVARRGAKVGAKHGPTSLSTYEIHRKDVLCDVDAFLWGQVYQEEELLVRPSDLRPLDTQILEALIQDVIENVLDEIST